MILKSKTRYGANLIKCWQQLNFIDRKESDSMNFGELRDRSQARIRLHNPKELGDDRDVEPFRLNVTIERRRHGHSIRVSILELGRRNRPHRNTGLLKELSFCRFMKQFAGLHVPPCRNPQTESIVMHEQNSVLFDEISTTNEIVFMFRIRNSYPARHVYV